MKKISQILSLSTISVLTSHAAYGQITPDASVGTQIVPNVNINGILSDRINGGTIRGDNLFHSFQEFNIDTQRGAYFTNPAGINNIFTQVTGKNPSNINGTLGVLGNANLFFLNPNGVVFGSGARLDLQGSFLVTTASSINFADGTQFSATNSQAAPLLTVSVPVGLGFGSTPGSIQVQGSGHNLTTMPVVQRHLFSPYSPPSGVTLTTGLDVKPGKTLALVGGSVKLNGGILTAASGRIELGSVGGAGSVGLNPTPQGFTLDYTGAPAKQNIQLSQRALVNVTGASSGSIQVQAKQIGLNDGSTIWSQNLGTRPGGDIYVRATELLRLNGMTPDETLPSSIVNETRLGASGNLTIDTKGLVLQNGTSLGSRTFSPITSGVGGKVIVNATDFIELSDPSPKNRAFNALGTSTFSNAKAGDLIVSTRFLSVQNGSYIAAVSLRDIFGDSVLINSNIASVIRASNQFSSISNVGHSDGNSGNITLNTHGLSVQNGGSISTSAFSKGSAGNIVINATESVEVAGQVPGVDVKSNISSVVGSSSFAVRRFVPQSSTAVGNSGNVTINTPSLKVSRGGTISVQNFGTGNAGMLAIDTGLTQLSDRATIAASTKSGEGGNIFLSAQNLQLRGNSQITTNADGSGNGGEINIKTDTIVMLENSDITANAVKQQGGNINIAAQGLFRTNGSDITASGSQNGEVNITTPKIKRENALQEQPANFVSSDAVMASSCLTNRDRNRGRFTVTNNGGLPETPDNQDAFYELVQVRSVNHDLMSKHVNIPSSAPGWKLGDRIQEATQMVATVDGRLVLTVNSALYQDSICEGNRRD